MNKKLIISAGVVIVIGAAVFVLTRTDEETNPPPTPAPSERASYDPRNATYEIDGQSFTLVNGIAEIEAAPGSASKIIVRYFGNEAKGDLNGDGREDLAYLITKESGGSGLFYYAVAALKADTGYTTTNAFFIGDRIAPQSTVITTNSRELHVNYAERKPGEPMTALPSVGATKLLKVTLEGTLEGLMK